MKKNNKKQIGHTSNGSKAQILKKKALLHSMASFFINIDENFCKLPSKQRTLIISTAKMISSIDKLVFSTMR